VIIAWVQACVNTAARQSGPLFPSELRHRRICRTTIHIKDQRPRSGGAHQATPCPPIQRRVPGGNPFDAAKIRRITTGAIGPAKNCPRRDRHICAPTVAASSKTRAVDAHPIRKSAIPLPSTAGIKRAFIVLLGLQRFLKALEQPIFTGPIAKEISADYSIEH